MADGVLSSVQIKWDDLCCRPAINRFYFDEKTRRISNQKGGVHSAQPTYQHEKWMKGKKEIIFVPDVPGFVLQLAPRFASQPRCPTKASIVKQTIGAYTGFTKEDLEALLGIALNGKCGRDDRGKLELTLDVAAEMRKLCWPCDELCRFGRRRIRLRGR